jgi:hypothetical protein
VISEKEDAKNPDWVEYTMDYIKLETGLKEEEITSGPKIVTNNSLQ